jgi:CO/xanthine dehydrogenase FAD-binding subunit
VKTEDELLTSISFNRPAEGFVGQFGKTGPRPALEISMVSVGVGGIVDNGGLTNARVVYGAVAPTPIRAAKTEAALEGLSLNEASIQSVLDVADSEVNPISDVRASDWYRRHLVRVMTQEVLQNVANG